MTRTGTVIPFRPGGVDDGTAGATSAPTDEELLIAFRDGDEGAFDRLVERHGGAVKGFAARVVGDPHLAEDIFVETFLRVFQTVGRWRPGGSVRSFVFTVAYRLCMDACRKRSRHLRAVGRLEPPPVPGALGDPEARAAASERAVVLERAIAALPEAHRAVVLLTYRHDLTSREVAEVLGCGDQEVRSRLSYARRLLRERLEDGGGDER